MAQVEAILAFLKQVGIVVDLSAITEPSFLPGLKLKNGKLIIDKEKLLYPGDILHEAGHLATMPPDIRRNMSDNLENNDLNQGGEMMALAWSYAACLNLNFDPGVVFHINGYKGESEHLVNMFSQGNYLGLPLLQWAGMAYDKSRAIEFNAPPFPHMIRWLREA